MIKGHLARVRDNDCRNIFLNILCSQTLYGLGLAYSGPSGIFGSDGKQSTAQAGDRGVRIVALSISSHEQTQ